MAFGFTQIDLERLIKKRHRLLSKSEKNFTDQALVRFLRSSLKVPKAQPGVGKKEIVNYQLLSSERPKTLTKHRKEKYSLSRKKHSFDMNFFARKIFPFKKKTLIWHEFLCIWHKSLCIWHWFSCIYIPAQIQICGKPFLAAADDAWTDDAR